MINGNMNNVVETIINKNTRNINAEDVRIIPCNTSVLIQFYEDNPYRKIETSDNGLILGIESTKHYKSNETGDIEENQEYIACAKVLAVGPKCDNVEVGDDVYVPKHIATTVPFRKMGYYLITEQNIMCRIIKND